MDRSIQSFDFWEILTTKEIMGRLKIGKTKLFELKRNGTLIPGRHFIQNGRVLRFFWGADLIKTIHEYSTEKQKTTERGLEKSEMKKRLSSRRGTINLNY